MDMKKIIFTISLFCFSPLFAQSTAEGRIFEDKNGNGKFERSEKGISEVAVTNGSLVVLTNRDGKYALPVKEGDIISVIKPSGYRFSTDENNLPQFYYLHKPQGSPESDFPGVSPTGKLPRKVDFALKANSEPAQFSALVFGDPQPYTEEEVEFFRRGIIKDLEAGSNFQFGLSLGDLVGNDLDLFQPYKEAVKEAGVTWFNVIGNHDLNFDAPEDALADETYEAHFGPANYAFNYGKVHFIVLDDILYPDPRDSKGYWGGFRADQLEFVKNDLKHVPKDHLIVLAFHIPISEPGGGDSFRNEDREQLFQLLKEFPHTLSLSAHTHRQRQDFMTAEEGWKQEESHHHYNVGTTSGNWYSGRLDEKGIPFATMSDGTPKGYAIINFNGNEYSIDYKVAGKPDDYRMEIFVPKVVAQGRSSKARLYVNYFMGSEQDKVFYRVDQGEWKEMDYVRQADPGFAAEVLQWDLSEELFAGRRPSDPAVSTHLWRGSIPTKLEVGEHTVETKVTDRYGRIFTQTESYRLEEPVSLDEIK